MTKGQYDHIRHILISTPKNIHPRAPIFDAVKYLRNISKNENGVNQSKLNGCWYILGIGESFDIVLKIQSKL
jgi:hypothetical protein